MPTKSPVRLLLSPVADRAAHANFREVHRALSDMHPAVNGRETGLISLEAGLNRVRPSVPHPRGRATVFQIGHATIVDVFDTVDENGHWLVDASAACQARFLFY